MLPALPPSPYDHDLDPEDFTSEYIHVYEGVSKRFRTGRLKRDLQVIQLSAARCSYIGIL